MVETFNKQRLYGKLYGGWRTNDFKMFYHIMDKNIDIFFDEGFEL